MGRYRRVALVSVLCWAAAAGSSRAILHASPQEPAVEATSLASIKKRLSRPPAPPLKPSEPVQLRPRFRVRITERPWVPTLEEHLRETFELTDFQRRYAGYAASCCGLDFGALFDHIEKAMEERRIRNVRAEIRKELAEVEAAAKAAKPAAVR